LIEMRRPVGGALCLDLANGVLAGMDANIGSTYREAGIGATASAPELSAHGLLRSRFAISPVSEVIEVARALRNPSAFKHQHSWLAQQRQSLKRSVAEHDLRPLVALLPAAGGASDFLRPAPAGPIADIECELAHIRAAQPETAAGQIERSLEEHSPVSDDVTRALRSEGTAAQLADLLAALWNDVVCSKAACRDHACPVAR
jgi:hypothetical protein